MFATAGDLIKYGYDSDASAMLARADARVRGYLSSRASAATLFGDEAVVPTPLKELVCAIASRMYATATQVEAGISMEVAGSETVMFGAKAYAGVVDLTDSEKAALNRLFPKRPQVVEI